ncbi:MAG: palindromic element RPE1 domain-containing protein [Rickettsia endosymbiont of Eriopis connexa]|nr:palindromic element RPE1 domain-containing protein [Rickettsia endosymbiont of Eriopis connexa]
MKSIDTLPNVANGTQNRSVHLVREDSSIGLTYKLPLEAS